MRPARTVTLSCRTRRLAAEWARLRRRPSAAALEAAGG